MVVVGRIPEVVEQLFAISTERRLRHPALWRYNLYCMIHGVNREDVVAQIAQLRAGSGLLAYSHAVLFSKQRFKQRGARYLSTAGAVAHG